MRFAHPEYLLWLWTTVPLGLFLFWAFRRKQKLLENMASADLLKEMNVEISRRRYAVRFAFLFFAAAFSLLALARPQWGYEWQEVQRKGLDIIVVIDTSRSMLTQDVRPNRLERTKLAVKDLLKNLKGDRIGLIAFAGEAFMVCPLTVDYDGFRLSLEDLDTDSIPLGGTNISAAVGEAIRGYDEVESKHKAVVILTDGENLQGDPLAAARAAKEKGVRIYCVGIGTREGELIRIARPSGEQEFLKDETGNFVKSRLNEKLLQEIALSTGGAYVRASGAEFGLDLIYEQELSKLERREIESQMEKRYHERFQFPLAAAFLFLVLEGLYPFAGRQL